MATKPRYSDEELAEFKPIVLKKLKEAKKNLKFLEEIGKNLNGTDDTSPSYKYDSSEGSKNNSKEEKNSLIVRQTKYIGSLENAVTRIENKTYGICSATGKLIPKERLKIVPHTTLCVEAEKEKDKRKGKK